MSTAIKMETIRLLYSQKESQVLVEPEDRDKFVMRVQEAIRACRIYQDYKKLFEEQLDSLKNILGKWILEREPKINKAFLTLQDARMLFLVVLNGNTYDRQLEEDLADLDLEIAQDPGCSLITLDVQALPLCGENAYISFCNPGWILEYSVADAR